MKILQIINSLSIGGAEKLIVDIVPLLNQNHIVDVLVLKDSPSFFKNQLLASGINVFILNSEESNIYSPVNIIKLVSYMHSYDIIHTHLFPSQYWVVFAKLLSFSSVKLITTEHNTDNRRRSKKWLYYPDKFIYSMYSNIICISDDAYRKQVDYIGFANKTKIIYNGINLEHYLSASRYSKKEIGVSEGDYIVTMVAGFRPQKDQDTLIKSIKYLPNDVKIILVGDGERRKDCECLVDQLGYRERVIFMGIRSDVARILKSSDLVVMSSYYEGLSLSSIEGMSVGRPFIASDVPGLSEIVKGHGVLFKLGDYNELANCIMELKTNSKLYDSVSAACLERAKEYDILNMKTDLLKTYENYNKSYNGSSKS